MARPRIDVVHVGSACRDLTPDDPRGWRLGGGAAYAALTTARLGLRTAALIGVGPDAASAEELDVLRDAGVELELARLSEGPVFDNRETTGARIQICQAVGRPLAVQNVSASWREAAAWSLVPVAGELDAAWAAAVPEDAYVALGWQGMLRVLVAGERVERRVPSRSALVRRADLVGVSHHDISGGTSLARLNAYLHAGADLLVTAGRDGGLLVRVGDDGPREMLRYRATASDNETDPTGAGDTFLAALLATVVRPAIAGRSRSRRSPDLRFAAAAGSLTVEGPGLSAVPDRRAVLARLARDRGRRAVVRTDATEVGWVDA